MSARNRRRAAWAWLLAAAAIALASAPAWAATETYAINLNGIYRIDTANSNDTPIWTGAPFPFGSTAEGPAALAQCADGTMYFTDRESNPATLYRFHPFTPAVAPVAIGPTTGTSATLLRMSCNPTTGVLYGMTTSPNTLYTLSTTTGAATGVALTLPGTTPPIAGSGDIAFDGFGTLYYIGEASVGVRLWTINIGTSTFANVGAITGLPNVANGISFTGAGGLLVSATNATQIYSAPVTGGAVTAIGSAGAMPAVTDLSSFNVPDPDLSITKTANLSGIAPSTATAVTYTIVATNSSAYAVTGTITDTFPAGISGVTWTCAASSGSFCNAASGSGNINQTARLAVGGTATYTVSVTANSATPITNTATVAPPFGFMADATPADNTASHTLNLRPTLVKSFSSATVPVRGASLLTLTLGNANPSALTLTSAFTDTLPTGLVVATPNGLAGTCTTANVTATSGASTIGYANGSTIPAGGCTIQVNVFHTGDTDASIANGAAVYTNSVAGGDLATSGGTNAAAANASLSAIGGYKSVQISTDADSSGLVTPTVGDTLTWSVFYFNPPNGGSAGTTVPAFQATDAIGANMTYVAGSLALTQTPAGCHSSTANASFNGGSNTNLFTASGNFTAPATTGCTVRFNYRTTVGAGAVGTTLSNQASGSGTNLAAVLTDNIDNTTTGDPANVTPLANSIAQTQVSTAISPTTTSVFARPTLAKSLSPTAIPAHGQGASTLTLTLGNTNAVAITLTSALTDTLPTGIVVATPNGLAGTCDTADVTATAGSGSISYASGASIPAGGCTIQVDVVNGGSNDVSIANASAVYTNTVAAGGLVTNAGTSPAAATASVNVLAGYKSVRVITDPDGTGTAAATIGDTLRWSVFYRNPSGGSTVTGFSVTDTLQPNMTLTGAPTAIVSGGGCGGAPTITGGYTGTAPNNVLFSGYNFPANCTVRVRYNTTVGASAAGTTLTNQASATGTGLAATLTDNIDTATTGEPSNVAAENPSIAQTQVEGISVTSAPVLAAPVIAKSFSPDPIAPGGTSTLTIMLTNPRTSALTAAGFTDLFPTSPAQMRVATPLTTSNTCGGSLSENDAIDGDTTLEINDGSVRLTGGTIPASGSCTITINVTAPTAGTYTNTIAAGALTTSGGVSAVAASDTLSVGQPSLTLVKSSLAYSDPFNSQTDPKRIPGGFVTYEVVATNSGAGAVDNDTTIVTDAIPANTDLFVGDVGGLSSGPVAFANGTPPSGLTYTFTALGSGADDVSFSSDGGATFTYTPVPNGNGVDPAVTHIRINPKGVFAGDATPGSPSPNFTLSFRVRIE